MNASLSSLPPGEPPPSTLQLPLNRLAPPPPPGADASGGARKLSRWEDLEELWLPEERNLTHSGINE